MSNPISQARKRAKKKLKELGVKVITPEMERGMHAGAGVIGKAWGEGIGGVLSPRFYKEIQKDIENQAIVLTAPEENDNNEEVLEKIIQESEKAGPLGKMNKVIAQNMIKKRGVMKDGN